MINTQPEAFLENFIDAPSHKSLYDAVIVSHYLLVEEAIRSPADTDAISCRKQKICY